MLRKFLRTVVRTTDMKNSLSNSEDVFEEWDDERNERLLTDAILEWETANREITGSSKIETIDDVSDMTGVDRLEIANIESKFRRRLFRALGNKTKVV